MIRDLTVEQNLKLTRVDVAKVRHELAEMDLDGLDLDEQVRDIPLPFLRMLDLARALAFDPQLLVLDEITAALPPDLSERVFAIMTRWKARNRSVLFISHRLAEVREHCDMCTILRDGRDVASFHPGQEGGESQIVAAMLGEASAGVRDVARERAARASAERTSRLVVRDLLIDRQATGVSFEVAAGRGPRHGRARGPGPGPAVRHPLRERPGRRGRDPGRRQAAACQAPLRGHPARGGAGAERPADGPAAAAAHPREHRRPAVQPGPPLGPDQLREGAAPGPGGGHPPVDRHPRRGPGAAPVGREPAEADHRPLAGGRVPHPAAVRPDEGHRRRHQAPDLRPDPRAGRRRRRHPDVHQRAARDRAGLRPGGRAPQRGHRAPRCRPPPARTTCSPPPTAWR